MAQGRRRPEGATPERKAKRAREEWAVLGSNQRPPACKAGALPAELTALHSSMPCKSEYQALARGGYGGRVETVTGLGTSAFRYSREPSLNEWELYVFHPHLSRQNKDPVTKRPLRPAGSFAVLADPARRRSRHVRERLTATLGGHPFRSEIVRFPSAYAPSGIRTRATALKGL